MPQTSFSQQGPTSFSCIVRSDDFIGRTFAYAVFADGRQLIQSDKGWFFAYFADATAEATAVIQPVNAPDTGAVTRMFRISGHGILIQAQKRWFFARETNDEVSIVSGATSDTGFVINTFDLPGVGALIQSEKGWFLARETNAQVSIVQLRNPDIGHVEVTREFPGIGLLIQDEKEWFLARETNDQVTMAVFGNPDTGTVFSTLTADSGQIDT
jgi:hypothetical protein